MRDEVESGIRLERKEEDSEKIGCSEKTACKSINHAAGTIVVRRPLD